MAALLTERNDSTLFLTLNRPEKRNALNDELIEALATALRDSEGDPNLRSIVIRGAGKDFCSGADLASLQKIAKRGVLENLRDAESLLELFLLIRKVEIPVIAAVRGRALAGGCGLATSCDIVLASETAGFGYPEVRIGFVPAMVMAILRRNVGEKKSFELVTRGFDFSADEAQRMGLVNRVYEDAEFEHSVSEFAAGYGRLSRSAVTLAKRLLYRIDASGYEEALRAGAEMNSIARMTEDCRKGIEKFLEK